jgi:hypothetical protein
VNARLRRTIAQEKVERHEDVVVVDGCERDDTGHQDKGCNRAGLDCVYYEPVDDGVRSVLEEMDSVRWRECYLHSNELYLKASNLLFDTAPQAPQEVTHRDSNVYITDHGYA